MSQPTPATPRAQIATDAPPTSRVDYGLDAPGIVKTFAALGVSLLAVGIAVRVFASPPNLQRLGAMGIWMGGSFALTSLLMVLSSRIGKLRARDRLLDGLALAGGETVLDVGCGHGLLVVGAAKRLSTGRAIGIDLWSARDQADNSAAAALANADAEGVRDRVDIRDGDMRALPLADDSVDAVVSSLAIHNLPTVADREQAIAEIVRVLRPGGAVSLIDIAHVGEYARALHARGCTVQQMALVPTIFPPARELRALKS